MTPMIGITILLNLAITGLLVLKKSGASDERKVQSSKSKVQSKTIRGDLQLTLNFDL
jgi:hypothetical protein